MSGRSAAQDRPDPAGESTPLGLDEVTDALVGAPLAGRRAPAAVRSERLELGDDRDARGGEQVGDGGRRERLEGRRIASVGHAGGVSVGPVAASVAVAPAGTPVPTTPAAVEATATAETPTSSAGVRDGRTGSGFPPSASQQAAA